MWLGRKSDFLTYFTMKWNMDASNFIVSFHTRNFYVVAEHIFASMIMALLIYDYLRFFNTVCIYRFVFIPGIIVQKGYCIYFRVILFLRFVHYSWKIIGNYTQLATPFARQFCIKSDLYFNSFNWGLFLIGIATWLY